MGSRLILSLLSSILVTGLRVQAFWLTDWFDLQTRNTFCQDNRTISALIDDDHNARNFLNRSVFDRMDIIGLDQINQLLIESAKAHASIKSCPFRQWGYQDDGLFELGNSPMQNDDQCRFELDELHNFMMNLKNNGAMHRNYSRPQVLLYRQLASFGRVPLGPLHTASFWLGDIEQCWRLNATRHCFAAYKTQANKPSSVVYPKEFNFIMASLCLPKSCTSRIGDQKEYLSKIEDLLYYNLLSGFKLTDRRHHHVSEVYCPPAAGSQWRSLTREPLGKIILFLGFIWILILVYCTILSKLKPTSNRDFRQTFDISHHMQVLFGSNVKSREPELAVFNIAKSLGMVLIINNHLLIMLMSRTRDLSVIREYRLLNVFFQAQHNVSMFFLISSFLVAYNHFKYQRRIQSPLKMIAKRYLRLIPMYIIVYAIIKQFGHAWGSGPFWDHAVSPQSGMRQCKSESWLFPLLMISNWVSPNSHCILTGWYLSVEFQIYCLMPLILYIYEKSKIYGRIGTFLVILLASAYRIWYLQTSENYVLEFLISDSMLYGPKVMGIRLWYLYGNPLSRVGTALIGVYLANVIVSAMKKETLKYQSSNNIELSLTGRAATATSSNAEPSDSLKLDLNGDEVDNDAKYVPRGTKFHAKVWHNHLNNSSDNKYFYLIISFVLLSLAYLGVLLPDSVKYMWGSYSKGFSYGFVLIGVDWAWFYLFYASILHRHKQLLLNNDTKLAAPSWIGFVNSRFWSVTGKLCFSNMLIHDALVRSIIHSSLEMFEFNYTTVTMWSTYLIILCHLFSMVVFICIESPLNELSKLIMYGRPKGLALQQANDGDNNRNTKI